jgi:phosphatidate cytidylyltransferase
VIAASAPGRDDAGVTRVDRWGDLRLRVASAAVLAPVALGCIWLGGMWFAGLVLILSLGLAHEWLAVTGWRLTPLVAAIFAAVPIAVVAVSQGATLAAVLILMAGTLAAWGVAGRRSWLAPFGVPYLGAAAVSLVWLRADPAAGRTDVIVLLLIVWASDIGAYAVGRAVGGPKLAPAISPGKTVSGAVGGLLAAMAVGLLAGLLSGGALGRALLAAGAAGCVAQAGDLFESALKRRFDKKDSGKLIPGHGGVLDRLDALLSAAVFGALLALAFGRGVVIWQ